MRNPNKRIFNAPVMICVASFLAWVVLLSYKYANLGYYDWDLAFFSQACWQLLHGSQYVSVTGINYFGDHSYFITFLTLPFFAVFPHPLTLVFLKIAAYIGSAYFLYRIICPLLGEAGAVLLMVLYIVFPANIFAALYDFNPESFAPPLLLWMYISFDKGRWKSFVLAAFLLMLIKENMALVVCAFGLYGLFRRSVPKSKALLMIGAGSVVFYFLVIHLIPYFRHLPEHAFVVRYTYLGHSVGQIMEGVLVHPHQVMGALLTRANAHYINDLFGAMLVPALFSPQLLFFISPVLLQHLLSMDPQEHSIYYHYGPTMAPFIFLAAANTLAFCRQMFERRLFVFLLGMIFVLSAVNLSNYTEEFALRLNDHADHLAQVRWQFVHAIPPQADVIASFDYLAPLSLRPHLYAFYKIYSDAFQNSRDFRHIELHTHQMFTLPADVQYALIDWQDPWLQDELRRDPKAVSARLRNFLQDRHWKTLRRYGSLVLLQRQSH